jgi:RNA polymerase sigma-70 factor (ECF subfamily)
MRLVRPGDPAPEPAAEPSDAALVARCQAGDRVAIGQLVELHSRRVERLLGRLLGPTPDLEDLVQTTFLRAIESLPRFRGEARFSTWVSGIAIHVAQKHMRAGRLRRHFPLEVVPPAALSAVGEPEHLLDERRLAPRLHALLDKITPRKRIALLLFVVEGHSVEEVAALMDATSTATRSRVFFARRELRKLVACDPHLLALVEGLMLQRGQRAKEGEP